MRLFRSRLPAAARAALETEPGERVLAHAATAGGGYVVATDLALHLPGGPRLPWHLVEHVRWDETGVVVTGSDGARHRADVPEPGPLPETVKERVTATILATRHVRLGDRGGVRLTARRVVEGGARDPVLEWRLVFDEGLDPNDPELRARAERALEETRRSLGI